MNLSQENPFHSPSKLPFCAPDFDAIDDQHYLPALEAGMKHQMQEIRSIAKNSEKATFENTIVALEQSGQLLTRVQRVFFNMASTHSNEKIREIQSEMAPKLAAHSDNIYLNRDLFSRIEILHKTREDLDLEPESLQLLKETYRDFVRAGAKLDEQEQNRLRKINERISSLTTEFQEKLLEMTRERAVVVEREEELDGLSSDRIAAAKEAANHRGYEGKYLLTITNTTRQPLLSSLNNRGLRKRLWKASAYRGIGQGDGVDTRPIVLELAELRAKKAELLGYDNWASYSLERETAKTPDNALDMLTDLVPDVLINTNKEAENIREMMLKDGIEGDIKPWDWEYYAEKVRKAQYDVDETELRPYFELDRVLKEGVFYTMNKLFGVTFKERHDLPVYHPDVRVFDVLEENGEQIGLFYGDFFERDSKRGGAWKSSFVGQSRLLDQKPVIVNVLNIQKPPKGEPALISFSNVTTLFHEMGHAVHGLFSDVTYPSLAGTSVPRDFVEFPSTFQEDWALNPDVLENYAVHHQTGERIPRELLDRLNAARDFNQGFDTQEYLAAAMLDLEWHLLPTGKTPDDVESFEHKSLAKYDLDLPYVPPRYKSPYFAHIFSGGYSANYYAYIWSEVLAADAFAFMKEEGGLTRKNGEQFRNSILSRGGSKDAMELYHEYRGREPDAIHLLKRRGLETK